jgi:Ca2+-binding EF-hand superfamily protein
MKEEVDLDQDGFVSKSEVIHKMEKSFSQQRQSEVSKLLDKFDISKLIFTC